MTTPYNTIKTRLKTLLQSERTIEFFNRLTNFGLTLGNSPQITNKFIKEVFQGEGIEIENKHNRKRILNNIIIDNKRILIRTNSIKSNYINFKYFSYERQEDIDFSNLKNKINNDLDNFDYIFLIRIEEEYDEEFDDLKVYYHYYLFPSEYFRTTENFPLFINKTSFSGVRWFLKNYKDFCFKYDLDSLKSFNICYPCIINNF